MIDTTSPIVWTRQGRGLWTGRRDGAPAGTIEQGARFAFVDLDGAPHPGFRTLADAQSAAVEPGPAPAGRRRVPAVLLLAGAFVVLLGAAALTAALLLA